MGCRTIFEERFSARRMAQDYLQIYQRLISADRRDERRRVIDKSWARPAMIESMRKPVTERFWTMPARISRGFHLLSARRLRENLAMASTATEPIHPPITSAPGTPNKAAAAPICACPR
jgi:hypothetical protein